MHGPLNVKINFTSRNYLCSPCLFGYAMKLHKQNSPNNLVTDLASVPN